MDCKQLEQVLSTMFQCATTHDGLRIATSCLYPSFDVVYVYIVKFGDGYQVHDGGGAASTSWLYGRDNILIGKELDKSARRFKLKVDSGVLSASAISEDWIPSAVLSVANGSAHAANCIVDHLVAAVEEALTDKIFRALSSVYSLDRIGKEFEISGKSGKAHKFDFALQSHGKTLLLDAVAPHHASIAHKYVSFSDVIASNENSQGFAVYERPLESDDASLMQQVADLVPLAAVSAGAQRIIV